MAKSCPLSPDTMIVLAKGRGQALGYESPTHTMLVANIVPAAWRLKVTCWGLWLLTQGAMKTDFLLTLSR